MIIGTRDSAEILAKMEYTWYKEGDAHLAPHFAARAILPYLLVGNLRDANASYRIFTKALSADNAGLNVQEVATPNSTSVSVFPSLPLLNFLGLLLLAVRRGAPEVFKGLLSKYATQINETSWADPLDMIGEMYFGIRKPRQANPLMDMMSGLFGGGGGGGAPQQRRPGLRDGPAAPGLD